MSEGYWEIIGVTEIQHTVSPVLLREKPLNYWHAPHNLMESAITERKPLPPGTVVLMTAGCDHNGFCDVVMPDGSQGCFHITELKEVKKSEAGTGK